MEETAHRYGEMCTGFWWGKLHERDHLEDLGLDGRIILRWILNEMGVMVVTVFV
jgi:hypothetical protein